MVKFIVIAVIVLASVLAVYFLTRAVRSALYKDEVLESKKERVITEQVVALGAEELPEGIEYIYSPDLRHGQYSEGECVVIRFDGQQWYSPIRLRSYSASKDPVEASLLASANSVKSDLDRYYQEHLKRKRLKEIVEGKAMLTLGDKSPWKEDN